MITKHKIGKVLIPLIPVNRRIFDLFRFELNAISLQIINLLNPFYYFKVIKLKKLKNISLNIGSGGRGGSDWINIDIKMFL
jgi:hypothetical protein